MDEESPLDLGVVRGRKPGSSSACFWMAISSFGLGWLGFQFRRWAAVRVAVRIQPALGWVLPTLMRHARFTLPGLLLIAASLLGGQSATTNAQQGTSTAPPVQGSKEQNGTSVPDAPQAQVPPTGV